MNIVHWCVALLGVVILIAIFGGARPAQAQSVPVTVGYRDFYFGTSVNNMPTGEKPQSKLWWNDGIWWGSLWDPALRKHAIYRFDVETQSWTSTGTTIDERTNAKADALWDGQHLYIVSQIFTHSPGPTTPLNSGRLYRYSYDSASQSYSLDAGFPVRVNSSISETLVLAKDTTGKLWVTWTEGGKVKVNRTLGNDLSWGTPFDLPVQGNDVTNDDISTIVALGDKKIGIMWSNENDRVTYFAIHLDGKTYEFWQPLEQALDDSDHRQISYDHINLKPSCDNDGNLYAVTKTILSPSEAPQIFMLKRDVTGVWTRYVFGTVSDDHTRPLLLIDGEHRKAYVFAMSAVGGDSVIYMKSTDLSQISFPPGLGTPFIKSKTDLNINNPTSTKQCLNSETGLLVLASDQDSRFYLHNYIDLDTGPKHYKLTVNTVGSGRVAFDPPNGTYEAGTVVTLAATPALGFQFRGWSGGLTGAANPATITMSANKNVTAVFTPIGYSGPVVNIETVTGGASNSATVTTSASLTAAGSQLYLAAIATKPSVSVARVNGLGLKWTLVRAQCAGRHTTGIEVWMAQGVPSGNGTVTATLALATANAAIAVSRYAGVDPINPLGNMISGNTNGTNGACDGGVDGSTYSFNLMTTANGAMIYGAATMRSHTHTAGAGYTERTEFSQGSLGPAASVAVEDKRIATASMAVVNGSFSGDVDWAVVAVEIKPPTPLSVDDGNSGATALPAAYQLEQNYPNPFNPSTVIKFSLPAAGNVMMNIYDVTGQLVRTLVAGEMAAGRYSVLWNGRNHFGHSVAAGTYLYEIVVETENGEAKFTETKRMTLLK